MDLTAPKVAETEYFDSPDLIDKYATDLALLIQNVKHLIVFTGAGVSTSAGIPDFRGPDGSWTRRAQGKELRFDKTATLQAIPTLTHMSLVALQNRGLLKYLISQNCDGLHRRSGILPDKISELHGNSNREYCKKCGKEYIRDFRAVAHYERSLNVHRTGRKCAICNGALHDTIINFGEDLPERAFDHAYRHAKKADLCLVLGSSIMVRPANTIPEIVGKRQKAKLVICNLQKTPLENVADVHIHARTDDLMTLVMRKLDIAIPNFVLNRKLLLEVVSQSEQRHQIIVQGIDHDGTPATFLQSVRLEGTRRALRTEPFALAVRDGLKFGTKITLELEFMGNYGEPNVVLTHDFDGDGDRRSEYSLNYDPRLGTWEVLRQGVS